MSVQLIDQNVPVIKISHAGLASGPGWLLLAVLCVRVNSVIVSGLFRKGKVDYC